MRLRLLLLVLLAAGGGCRSRSQAVHAVTIRGRTWRVELAVTGDQRYRGLSGRKELASDAGMLFIFPREQVREFCMRDCFIPLDIAFIDSDLRVVMLHTMAVEPDRVGRVPYGSEVPAQYALEVPAGALEAAGVQVGDRVEFSADIFSRAKELSAP
jgi:uncharacterized membrane protein (UPF0127 family)